jgi:2-C-methyl-D-erythritol 4-phosphate cytidylyltransferase
LTDFAIVLVAAGASTRMGFPKLWADLNGAPLLSYAVRSAQQAEPTQLVIVVAPERLADAARLAPNARTVAGGVRRRDSVAIGLSACTCEWVAIHDAARALAGPEMFQRGLLAAQSTGAAIPGVPLKDTIKRVSNASVLETPPRSDFVAVQTPQIFRRDVLERALAFDDRDVTDEAALVEQLGISVAVFEGEERAFKVTTPFDFALARTLLE